MTAIIKEKIKGVIASRGIIHLPAKIKKKLGFSDHKSILISIEGNKLVIELESEDKLSKELEMKKKDLLNFIESINLTPKEEISVEDFLNDSRRY